MTLRVSDLAGVSGVEARCMSRGFIPKSGVTTNEQLEGNPKVE
jgi:hypothetical protein